MFCWNWSGFGHVRMITPQDRTFDNILLVPLEGCAAPWWNRDPVTCLYIFFVRVNHLNGSGENAWGFATSWHPVTFYVLGMAPWRMFSQKVDTQFFFCLPSQKSRQWRHQANRAKKGRWGSIITPPQLRGATNHNCVVPWSPIDPMQWISLEVMAEEAKVEESNGPASSA